jgi:endonuclease-3
MEALTALPGVGRKTANVVLGHALGVPGLPVDRPCCASSIGSASCDPRCRDRRARAHERASARTLDALPARFILHGRRICRPRPLCDRCAVRSSCA